MSFLVNVTAPNKEKHLATVNGHKSHKQYKY